MDAQIAAASARIVSLRQATPASRSVLVAVTGIDGSGKGWVAERLRAGLTDAGLRTGVIGVDGWLNLPAVRFDPADPGPHFYRHALRLDAMFAELVLPLREQRSVRVEVDYAEETATSFRRHTWHLEDLDVVLLEGIFLLERPFQDGRYDLAVWVDCSFATALERAIARAQEGLPPAATVHSYATIYFPAQRLHLALDAPRAAADLILDNDGSDRVRAGAEGAGGPAS